MAGTEKSFSGEFWDSKEVGIYKSIASGEIIFSSTDKYYSSSGWPTFSRPAKVMPGKKSCIVEVPDNTNFMVRTEIACSTDGIHLGHVFDDGPVEVGGLRYCMNSAAMQFVAKDKLSDEERKFYFP